MELTPSVKEYIDSLSYKQLLERWRFAPVGDSYFQGESGDYFSERMKELKRKLEPGESVRISKEIGWGD